MACLLIISESPDQLRVDAIPHLRGENFYNDILDGEAAACATQ